ncbi:hypothetical protein ACFWPA_04190 [Rhodococcus sp. NPDC058505]|uniref:hypothetical protein n=1 Tax=unclassified Rhodococcus (in: high G+C Gram-positive bacteria) TaxID=192944 RepID=UPI0036548A9A
MPTSSAADGHSAESAEECPAEQDLAELAVTARRLQLDLDRVRGRAQTPDGRVRIEVGVDGRMTVLDLHPDALRLGADRLARTITDLHAAAREDAEASADPLRAGLLTDPRVARALGRIAAAPPAKPEADPDRYYTTFSVFGTDPDRRG